MIRRTYQTARTFLSGAMVAAVVVGLSIGLLAQGTLGGIPQSMGMPNDFGWALSIGTQNAAGTSTPFSAAPVTGSVGGGVHIIPDLRQGIGSQSLDALNVTPTITTRATGTDALLTSLHVGTPVITSGGATITVAATEKVEAAPAGGASNFSLWVVGATRFDAGLGITNATSGTITLAAPTGALGSVTNTLPDATGSIPSIYNCGASLAAAGACPNTTAGAATFHIVVGTFLLAGNTSTVTGISPAFTSSTSWNCVANDITTRANPVQAIPGSGSTVVITNTTGATDLISMICAGS